MRARDVKYVFIILYVVIPKTFSNKLSHEHRWPWPWSHASFGSHFATSSAGGKADRKGRVGKTVRTTIIESQNIIKVDIPRGMVP